MAEDADDYHVVHIDKSQTVKDVILEKNKKLYDIRVDGKRLWIKSTAASIKYPYSTNKFNKTSVVFNLDDTMIQAVKAVDAHVYDHYKNEFVGKIMNNMKMTDKTLQTMFRDSLYNGTLSTYVSADNCAVFSKEKGLISDPNLGELLKSDVNVSIVVEPAFSWYMDKKIGIHWDLRQVKINGMMSSANRRFVQPKTTPWAIKKDDDDEKNHIDPVSKAKTDGAKKYKDFAASGWKLSMNDSSDDEGENKPVSPRAKLSKKTASSTEKEKKTLPDIVSLAGQSWRIQQDSSDDEDPTKSSKEPMFGKVTPDAASNAAKSKNALKGTAARKTFPKVDIWEQQKKENLGPSSFKLSRDSDSD